ncbi:Crp/Fnr family transcriptional regulator [Sphingomonas jeddahensis]|uniref:Transcriptional activatory protein AadR n=1 Tax=Sphingomonas jeddahensis TaxID=1915074 RepID=A0A1V2EWQ5_9SPHN|nr:Crp/Fnr family transcriptional regulator [Sphingomonas jeddahensis]ONF97111.1 Transcriptional activatory protein AadR [Sphingomonas jeddahensis]
MSSAAPLFASLIRKLRLLAPTLNEEDEDALLALPHRLEHVRARSYLVREGTIPDECCLLIEGYAARSKLAFDGGRQIVSFHIAGDILDIQHLFLERADHDIQAITDAAILWISKAELRKLVLRRPAISVALWRDSLIDASIFREWVLNVGRRDARTRIAHMLCEFIARCEAVGLGTPQRMNLPFSQEEIADATGLTPVHVNRMLRELSEEGLITRSGRALEVQNWDRFQRVAGFNQAYLHAAAA